MTDPFSVAQLLGYLAFVLGISSFLQKRDQRLKALNSAQSFVSALHYLLLGNEPAATTALVSSIRSALALRTRSLWVAAVLVVANFALALAVGVESWRWIAVVAGAVASVAIFTLAGIALRLVLFCCTLAWLTNNLLTGSFGGIALETVIAVTNLTTIARLWRDRRAARRRAAGAVAHDRPSEPPSRSTM